MQWPVGTRCTVNIEDLAFGGEGVARLEGFVLFVPYVIPGEVVEVELTEVKKQFARARLLRIQSPSPERVTPECRYFGACGGCQYQHLEYSAQLRHKRKQVADLFERVGGFDPGRVEPVLPCPTPYGYRNRILIRSQWNKPEQKLNLGFVRHDSGLVEDIEECRIAEPGLNELVRAVRNHPPPRGGIKVELRLPVPGWEVGPGSFFQNNFHLLPTLVHTVRAMLRDAQTRHLVDVYCGVGFFGIELARDVESFAGVEYDRQAIHAARRNAASHGVTNGQFTAGTAESELPRLLESFEARHTTALLDPPRKGCAPETLQTLQTVAPRQILYVSCHPATMARDLKNLCGERYTLRRVVPLDMFPQTQHVECIADLRVRDTDAASP
ncbi:MAG: class I SAM-dependent RNA methyltransferase [Verrucomicrobia bacterium]|nr:class I SAM-dependent RNA methyltransferase [Verrucomicrobiota bacterium]